MKLSPKLMKSIGTTIYQIDPSKLEEGILSKKKKAKPIGKKNRRRMTMKRTRKRRITEL